MVSLSNNWTVRRNRKSGDWVLEHSPKHGRKVQFSFSNRAALALVEAIESEQTTPTSRKKMEKLPRNRATQEPLENFTGCNGAEWLDRVRPDVIDFTHALILAKEAGFRISSVDTNKFLTPYEAGKLNPEEVTIEC